MVDAEDLPGGLKARARLKQMEMNPPKRNGSRGGLGRQYVESLYVELRAVREKGWSWKAILDELYKVDGFPNVLKSNLPKVFAQVDREWERKTGQKALAVKRYVRKGRKGNGAGSAPAKENGEP